MNKRLSLLMTVFFMCFLIFISFVIFEEPLSHITKAKEEFLPSGEKSLILPYPLTVNADGQAQATINVFIRSTTDVPIANQTVTLVTTLGEVAPPSGITDNKGKVSFTLTSSQTGIATIEAKVVNGPTLIRKTSILFE